MLRVRTGLIVLAVALFTVTFASAALISVDGDLTDASWALPQVTVGWDPNEPGISDDYDIESTRNLWDPGSGMTFFNMGTYAPLVADDAGNFVDLMIDADMNVGTGTTYHGATGSDYLFHFDLKADTLPNLTYGSGLADNYGFYKWNTGTTSWDLQAFNAGWYLTSRNTPGGDGVEWGVLGSAIGGPATFSWALFLDDGDEQTDDFVLKQTGHAPEPATLALFALGLGGLILKRRRSK